MEHISPASESAADDSPDPIAAVHRTIATEATQLIAAIVLAHEGFPRPSDLPRLAAVPANHLGHQVLLDYARLARILWGTVHEIQQTIRQSPGRYLAPLFGLLFAGGGLALGALILSRSEQPGPAIAPIVFGLLIGLIVYQALRPKAAAIAADVRARNLRLLLRGEDPPCATQLEKEWRSHKRVAWGNGEMSPEGCPVLVMTSDERPFPGFGRLQGRELFLCRPADAASPPALSHAEVNAAIAEALAGMAKTSGLSCVSTGSVVILDGRTLRKNSPWLRYAEQEEPLQGADSAPAAFQDTARFDGSMAWNLTGTDSTPPLFVPTSQLARVSSVDPLASVRVYTCVQAVVPEYLMCVTFFVRTFLAGNSVACEVNVSTLGPPILDWDYVRARLRVAEREQQKGYSEAGESWDRPARVTELGARLSRIRSNLQDRYSTFKSQGLLGDVLQLDPFDKVGLNHEKGVIGRIVKYSDLWPGLYTEQENWREAWSVTFTSDFFGNMESRAVLRTLYDRISRSALAHLKELGFDISDYQDESGKFSIKADSIDHLIVGERVYMDHKPKKKDAEKSEQGKSDTEGSK